MNTSFSAFRQTFGFGSRFLRGRGSDVGIFEMFKKKLKSVFWDMKSYIFASHDPLINKPSIYLQ